MFGALRSEQNCWHFCRRHFRSVPTKLKATSFHQINITNLHWTTAYWKNAFVKTNILLILFCVSVKTRLRFVAVFVVMQLKQFINGLLILTWRLIPLVCNSHEWYMFTLKMPTYIPLIGCEYLWNILMLTRSTPVYYCKRCFLARGRYSP